MCCSDSLKSILKDNTGKVSKKNKKNCFQGDKKTKQKKTKKTDLSEYLEALFHESDMLIWLPKIANVTISVCVCV